MSTPEEECDDTMASAGVPIIQIGEENTLEYFNVPTYEESQSDDTDEENMEASQNEEEENALSGNSVEENATLIDATVEDNSTLEEDKMEDNSTLEEDKMEDNSTLEEDKLHDNTFIYEETLDGPSKFDEELMMVKDPEDDLRQPPLTSGPTSSMCDKEEEFVNRLEGELETINVEEKSTIQRVERSSIRERNQESIGDANSGIERSEHGNQTLHLPVEKNTVTPVISKTTCLQSPPCTSTSNFDSNSTTSRKNTGDCTQTMMSLRDSLPTPAIHQQGSRTKPVEQRSIPTCRHEDQKTFPIPSTSVLEGFVKQGSEPVVETKQCDHRNLTDDGNRFQCDLDGFGKQGIKAMVEAEPSDERSCTGDEYTSESNLDVRKKQKSNKRSLTKNDTRHFKSSFGKDGNKAELLLGDCEKSETKYEAKGAEKDLQDSQENRPTLHVHQHGPNNKLALYIGDRLESTLNLPENTEVKVFTKLKSGKKRAKKSKTRIRVTIEDEDDAENATFYTIKKKYCRDILDRFFEGMKIIIELILPGSIILEIKPTSEGSIKSLLKSVKDGSLNKIVKQILEQESVFKHIRGKKVTVNLEITIPEDLLEEEGIIILENTEMELDEKSKINVTVKEQDVETVSDDESDSDGVEDEDDDDGDYSDADADAEDDDGVSDADFKDAADNDGEDDADDDADLKTSDEAPKQSKSGDVIGTTHLTSRLTEACVALPEKPSTSKDFSIETKGPHSKRCMDKLTFSSLHDMLDCDPSEILLTFKKNLRSLRLILNHPQLKAKTTQSLIVLLGKMSTTSMTENVNEILLVVLQSKFFEGYLSEFILNMDDGDAKLSDTLKFVLKISREILNKMPTDGFNKVQQITYLVQGKWSQSELSDPELNKHIDTLLTFLKVTKSQREKQTRRTTEVEDYSIPVESFRDLPITAKKSELDGTEEVLVLPNKIGRGFTNLEHYLECQFRLFRADVILPLKQNIEDFKRADMSMTTSFRAYKQVKILRPMCLDNGIGYRLAFDPKPFRNVKWERSQRLIFGSLLLLSSDGFTNDFMFATVDTREPAMLQKGLVDVQFVTDIEFAALPRGQVFDMVESQAYFESYKDVLKGMQEVTEETFPFKEYIVECRNIEQEPMYLRENKSFQYDLRPLVDDSVKITATAKHNDEAAFSQDSEFAEKIRIQYKESWPPIDNLDDSQITAVQNALTREFALIQGPPGTGKTYVGIKILKVLLHNQAVWMDQGGQLPILVVCYTNHALDQFLEGVLDMFDGSLIRVGGRIKSERLQKYSLREARQRIKDKKDVPSQLFEAKMKTIRSLKKLRKKMEKIARTIEAAEREIIRESHLAEFMLKKHAAEFTKSGVSRLTIQEWLGIESKLLRIEDDFDDSEDLFEDVENDDSNEEEGDGRYESLESRQSRRQLEEDNMDDFGEPYDHGESEEEEEKDLIAVDVTNLDNYKEPKFLSRPQRQLSRDKAKKKRKFKSQLMGQISSNDMYGPEEQKQIKNIRKMSAKDRWRLYRFWVDKLSLKARTDIKIFEEEYKRVSVKFKKILMEVDKIILKNCSVIGMTTTGAARYQRILNEIGPKIILVEEAAEVLEAHIVGSLSKRCEHLILIGDHKQLRPNPTVHSLAKNYNLEISLFERMVKSEIRCDMLQWQHRMRPEIADVIRPIYDNLLKDHPLVQSYDNVRGVAKNIFFVDHQNDHSFDEETKSFRNVHEAEYLSALYRYLIKQGYKQSQITVLTFYSAQIDCLNRFIQSSEFKGRRICAVDGYQGEENDIILLSLVRSKKEGTIGFLKEENRICVALSRAKIGMYVIGNFTHLAENSNLLETICNGAYKQKKIAPALPLCCPRHLDNVRVEALTPEDFTAAPEGGCKRQCDYRLPCGHVCTKVCHAGEHNFEQCSKPCKRRCKNGHQTCTRLCYEECSPCQDTLKTTLKCGHVQNVPCCKDPMTFHCKEKCQDNLECGHSCPGFCGAPHPPCTVAVDADLPCGHHVKTTCGQKDDPSSCNAPCSSLLECGHTCQGSCGSCHQGRLHQPCKAKCMNILICGHKCESTCNNCPPCERDCERKCSHRKCNKKCREPCIPCSRPCDSKCRHMECKLECNQICQRERCNDKCRNKLKCKHFCIGICGEPCPDLCGTCNKTKFDKIVSSTEGTAPSKPRLILLEDCGCIFEAISLDKFMDKKKEAEGRFGLIECPKCHSPIRQSNRYDAIVKETLEDVEKAKIKVLNSDRRRQLKETFEDLSARFKASYKVTVDKIRKSSTDESEESLAAKLTQLQLLKKVASLEETINRSLSIESEGSVKVLLDQLASFKTWISSERTVFSRQEIRDSSREVTRLSFFFYCLAGLRSDRDLTEDFKGRLRAWISRLEMSSVLTEKKMVQLRTLKDELIQKIPSLRVRACEEEQMITPVYNFNRKTWHKCKKGHVFAKAESVSSKSDLVCPECGDNEGAVGMTSFWKGDNSLTDATETVEASGWTEEMDRELAMSLDKELNG